VEYGNKLLLALAAAGLLAAAALPEWMTTQISHSAAVALLNGVLLAVLLLKQRPAWVRWSAAVVVVGVIAEMGWRHTAFLAAFADMAGHVLGAVATAWLVHRVCGSPFRIDVPRNVVLLAVFAAVPGAALSATTGFLMQRTAGQDPAWMAWMICWTGYLLGCLIVTPLILALHEHRLDGRRASPLRWFEGMSAAVILAFALHFIFEYHRPLAFLILPLMLWIGLRFGLIGMTLAVALLAVMGLSYTAAGLGPYTMPMSTPEESVLMVQSFLILVSVSGLLLVAVTRQRQFAMDELRHARDSLDAQVMERTAELRESERRLREADERFGLARAAAKIIVIDWDVQRDELAFSDSPEWLRGPLPASGKYPNYKDQVHADDRAHFLAMRDRAVQTMEGQSVQYRMVRTDGVVLHMESFQTMLTGPDGKAARLVAVHQDISARKQAEITLREREQLLRTLLDAIPDAVRLKDAQGRYIMVNRAAQAHMGLPAEEIVGRTVYEVVPREVAERIDEEERRTIASGRSTVVERGGYLSPNTWQEAILAPIRDADGTVTGLVSVSRDISERKLAELEALRDREEQYRALVEQASDVIYRTNPSGFFTYFNSDHALRPAGYSREELIGKHYLEVVHPDHRARTEAFYNRQFRERKLASYYEFPIVTKDGGTLWVGQHVNVVIEKSRILYHQAVCRDITERVAAQQALRETNEKLRQLSARQEEVLEVERTRIAHDLHDGIGQSLNLARIKVESALQDAVTDATKQRLRDIIQIIDATNAAIRTLEFDLSPPVLRELGLAPAFEWLAEDMQRTYGLRVGVSDDGEPKALNALSGAIAFRTVRELLINVVRHAGIMQAHIDLQRAGDNIIITVSDEGRGFDAKVIAAGLGLVSVRERLGYVGGSVVIDSVPDEGTVATLKIPLAEGAVAEAAA